MPASHEPLDRIDGTRRVGDGLPLRRLADQCLPFRSEGDHRGGQPAPFLVGDDRHIAAFHHRDHAVGRPEIDPNDLFTFCHDGPPLEGSQSVFTCRSPARSRRLICGCCTGPLDPVTYATGMPDPLEGACCDAGSLQKAGISKELQYAASIRSSRTVHCTPGLIGTNCRHALDEATICLRPAGVSNRGIPGTAMSR